MDCGKLLHFLGSEVLSQTNRFGNFRDAAPGDPERQP